MPKLSVVMPTYDDEKYLPTALDAILSQSFKDFELILINDASPDDSERIIQEYLSKDNRIRYIKNDVNLGAVRSFNKGSRLATGVYMYHASSDDRVLPGFFEEMMNVLLQNPHIHIATSDNGYFNSDNEKSLHVHKLIPNVTKNTLFDPSEVLSLYRSTRFLISGHSTIFKTKEAEKLNFYAEEIGYTCDFVLLNALALKHGVAYMPKTLSAMRQLPKSRQSSLTRNEAIRLSDHWISYIKKDKSLWKLFYSSSLIERTIHSSLFTVFLKPKHWDIVLPMCFIKMKLLFKKLFSKLTTTWEIVELDEHNKPRVHS